MDCNNKEVKKTELVQNCEKEKHQIATAYDGRLNADKRFISKITDTKDSVDDDLKETAEDRAYFSNI